MQGSIPECTNMMQEIQRSKLKYVVGPVQIDQGHFCHVYYVKDTIFGEYALKHCISDSSR